RDGRYFISGRKDIPTPTPTSGTVAFDKKHFDKSGQFRFVFSDEQAASDYADEMAETGQERVLSVTKKWMHPVTHKVTSSKEIVAEGRELHEAYPVYMVTLQDRFMAMSDSQQDLIQLRDEMRAEGYTMADPRLSD